MENLAQVLNFTVQKRVKVDQSTTVDKALWPIVRDVAFVRKHNILQLYVFPGVTVLTLNVNNSLLSKFFLSRLSVSNVQRNV